MDHLKEYVKGWIEFQKENFNNEGLSEEDIFNNVMENVISIVEDYSFTDYVKGDEIYDK